MYLTKFRSLQRFWAISFIILFISGCASTINFRDIQRDFNKAVEADNTETYGPQNLGTLTTTYQQNYEDILQRLSEPYIKGLDDRLKMNAYTMKAVSQWRTGKLDEARQTISQSQPDSAVGARDRMVLMILPALIDDQELTRKYLRLPLPRQVSWEDYEKYYKKGYYQGVWALKEAIRQIPPELPENMVYYVHYQRWRILNNWNIVATSLKAGKQKSEDDQIEADKDLRVKAGNGAKDLLGDSLEKEIQKEREAVPETNPLGKLMRSLTLPTLPSGVKPRKPSETQPS